MPFFLPLHLAAVLGGRKPGYIFKGPVKMCGVLIAHGKGNIQKLVLGHDFNKTAVFLHKGVDKAGESFLQILSPPAGLSRQTFCDRIGKELICKGGRRIGEETADCCRHAE